MNRLPEILSNKDIFYIATHPYAEDIQVEPKSLYGFILPLFTEFFVDNKASGKYYGGYFADDFKPYAAQPASSKELRILPRLSLSTLVKIGLIVLFLPCMASTLPQQRMRSLYSLFFQLHMQHLN